MLVAEPTPASVRQLSSLFSATILPANSMTAYESSPLLSAGSQPPNVMPKPASPSRCAPLHGGTGGRTPSPRFTVPLPEIQIPPQQPENFEASVPVQVKTIGSYCVQFAMI